MTSFAPSAAGSRGRRAPGLLAQLFGLVAGPAAWIGQLLLGYGVSSYACYPAAAALEQSPPPGWAGERPGLLVVNLAALLVALAGLAVARRVWRGSQPEAAGAHPDDLREGRIRFLAGCGMLASGAFALAILFDTAAVLGVPACWAFAP